MCTLCMVVQDCVVTRIDEGLGLVLEMPTEPAVTAGFVHISNAGDTKIDKLQQVCCAVFACPLPSHLPCLKCISDQTRSDASPSARDQSMVVPTGGR